MQAQTRVHTQARARNTCTHAHKRHARTHARTLTLARTHILMT